MYEARDNLRHGHVVQQLRTEFENALKNLAGVSRVDANHEGGTVKVVVNDDVENEDIHAAIEQAGYDIAGAA